MGRARISKGKETTGRVVFRSNDSHQEVGGLLKGGSLVAILL